MRASVVALLCAASGWIFPPHAASAGSPAAGGPTTEQEPPVLDDADHGGRGGARGSSGTRRLTGTADLRLSSEGQERGGRFRFFDISGYIKPTFGLWYRPEGTPQDRWDTSVAATQVGVEFVAEPVRAWFFTAHLSATGETLQNLSSNGGGRGEPGSPMTAAAVRNVSAAISISELALSYQPADAVYLSVGQMPIPFTLGQQSGSTGLLFPARNTPSEVFLRGSDLGALATFDLAGRAVLSGGAFNGASVTAAGDNERGILYAARADLHPFGPLPLGSADFDRGPLRAGIGGGIVFMPGRQFDETGAELMRTRDLRASGALRFAFRGLSLQAEVLRRQRTTNLSTRPLLATGAYAQASFYQPLTRRLAVAPIARVGWLREDEAFDPRDTVRTEAGASLYITGGSQSPDDIRLTLQYLGERRITEGEAGHGVLTQFQLRW